MPIEIPKLDDRTYDDLVAEGLALIPRYAPSWTDHNPTDPGITLIELLAYFTEILIYRLDRVSRENKIKFLRLLCGPDDDNVDRLQEATVAQIEEGIRNAVLKLNQPQRAVTCDDYERLARQALSADRELRSTVRVRCVVGKNLSANTMSRECECPGHVSLTVMVGRDLDADRYRPILQCICDYLEPRRLLTTRIHVIEPCYVWLSIAADIQPEFGVEWEEVRGRAAHAIGQYFSPFDGGGPQGQGWPYGRNFYFSEVYEVLERVPGIDFIEYVRVLKLSLSGEFAGIQSAVGFQLGVCSTIGQDARIGADNKERLIRSDSGSLIGIALRPYELIRVVLPNGALRPLDTLNDGGLGDFRSEI